MNENSGKETNYTNRKKPHRREMQAQKRRVQLGEPTALSPGHPGGPPLHSGFRKALQALPSTGLSREEPRGCWLRHSWLLLLAENSRSLRGAQVPVWVSQATLNSTGTSSRTALRESGCAASPSKSHSSVIPSHNLPESWGIWGNYKHIYLKTCLRF